MSVLAPQTAQALVTGKQLLLQQRDPMIDYMVEEYNVESSFATLTIDELWNRQTGRLMRKDKDFQELYGALEEKEQQAWAERTMNQAILFVVCCGKNRGETFAPSEEVDIGWHLWKLYSLETEAFEMTMFGRRIHHTPADILDYRYPTRGLIPKTADTIAAMGLAIDRPLWPSNQEAKCNDDGTAGGGGYCACGSMSFYDGR